MKTLFRWSALLAIPPVAAWSADNAVFDRAKYHADCWAALTVSTPPMSCAPGFVLIGVALFLGLLHLIAVVPCMAWIAARLRAGKTSAQRVRRQGLIVLAIGTPVFAAIAMAIHSTLRDFLMGVWMPISVDCALSVAIVTMATRSNAFVALACPQNSGDVRNV